MSEALVPKKTIQVSHFPSAPAAAVGLGIPAWFGVFSAMGHAAGTDIPELDGDVAREAVYDIPTDTWTCGWGENPGPAPPTNVQAVEDTDGGAPGLSQDVPGATYYLQVLALDAAGVHGNPEPFLTTDCPVTLTGSTSAIVVTWDASIDPITAKYRVALMWRYAGTNRTMQCLDTTGTTVTFTRGPDWDVPPTLSNITPGAILGYYDGGGFVYPTVAALMSDGETEKHTPAAYAYSPGYTRHMRMQWIAVAGATGYRVYFSGCAPAGWPYDRYLEVTGGATTYLDFDWADWAAATPVQPPARASGAIPVIYTGIRALAGGSYHEFLIAGHACDAVDHWYWDDGTNPVEIDQDAGTIWFVPGQTGWSGLSPTPYRDLVGSGTDASTLRITAIYGLVGDGTNQADLVAAGTATLTVDLRGWEDQGDGSGDVVDDLYLQFADWANYFVLGDGTGIRPLTPPMIPGSSVCQLARGTFRTLSARRALGIAGGVIGAGGIGNKGERLTVTAALTRWMESGDFRLGSNRHWQIIALAFDPDVATANLPVLTDAYDIQVDSFRPAYRWDELENNLIYRHSFDWVAEAWRGDNNPLPDPTSIAGYQTKQDGDASFWFLRSAAVAAYIAGLRQAMRSSAPPMYAELEGNLRMLSHDLDSYVKVTHFEGPDQTGWTERTLWVLGLTQVIDPRRVRLECQDVQDLLTPTT